MSVLETLEPKEVFHFFEEICNIPHASYKEEQISEYCVNFAKERNLEVYQDSMKNVVIIKEAAPGYENVEPLILQGHLDMVCEKEAECDIDFDKDGLRIFIHDDYIEAEGTTLGADDGIALAYILAILDAKALKHPRIEVIFTTAEEVGMEGAAALDVSMLKGRKLLNIDSEEEGYLWTSCAGGCMVKCKLPVAYENKEGILFDVVIDGLIGGHSGVEIDKGRGNSNILFGRLLLMLENKVEYTIAELTGGLKDNAIPRETKANLLVSEKDVTIFMDIVRAYDVILKSEYTAIDAGVRVTAVNKGKGTASVLTEDTKKKAVILLNQLPNGIQSMSAHIPGLVETSLNLGIMDLTKDTFILRYAVRSSVQTAKEYIVNKLVSLTEFLEGEAKVSGNYPAWEYKQDSKLREDMIRVYKEMYGKEPVIQALHAGLECGILAGKLPELDAISFGPDMVSIHTTKEKLSISSTKRVWDYLLAVIACKSYQ